VRSSGTRCLGQLPDAEAASPAANCQLPTLSGVGPVPCVAPAPSWAPKLGLHADLGGGVRLTDMCLICVDFDRGALKLREAKRALGEMRTTLDAQHLKEVEKKLNDAERAADEED
jgi:hypothetical protein